MSKCVYLASISVTLEHAVGVQKKKKIFVSKCISDGHVYRNIGHNQSQNCENLCFSPSKFNHIHGKLNKIEFCYKFCRILLLGRIAAIITDNLRFQMIIACYNNNNKKKKKCFVFTIYMTSKFIIFL